ncbi:unnamed protein product [Closterium sp. NIES-64]|nr:unnamed protein product [Closterium sp. NIES-64]
MRPYKHYEAEEVPDLDMHLTRYEVEQVSDLDMHLTVHSVSAKVRSLPCTHPHSPRLHRLLMRACLCSHSPSLSSAYTPCSLVVIIFSLNTAVRVCATAISATAFGELANQSVGALSLAAGWLARVSPRLAVIRRGVQHAREVAKVATGGGLWGEGGGMEEEVEEEEEEEEEGGEFSRAERGEARGRGAGGGERRESPFENPFDGFPGWGSSMQTREEAYEVLRYPSKRSAYDSGALKRRAERSEVLGCDGSAMWSVGNGQEHADKGMRRAAEEQFKRIAGIPHIMCTVLWDPSKHSVYDSGVL